MASSPRPRNRAFTLIEILIVVVILGILAAIVIPQFTEASGDAARAAFITNGRTFSQAAVRFQLDHGAYPEDAGSGVLPAGFDDYIQRSRWEGGTPIGGVWDAENNSFGLTSSVGVHFDGTGDTQDAAYMLELDTIYDDGDLATGGFRQIAGDRYYFVVAE